MPIENQGDLELAKFTKDAESLFTNLNSSSLDRINFIKEHVSDGSLTDAEMMIFQEFQQMRQRMVSIITDMSKAAHELAMKILSNLK